MELSTASTDSHPQIAQVPTPNSSFSLTLDDYKYLVSLLHASKNEASSSVN